MFLKENEASEMITGHFVYHKYTEYNNNEFDQT